MGEIFYHIHKDLYCGKDFKGNLELNDEFEETLIYCINRGALKNYKYILKFETLLRDQAKYYSLLNSFKEFKLTDNFYPYLLSSSDKQDYIGLIKYEKYHYILSFYFTLYQWPNLFHLIKRRRKYVYTNSLIEDYGFPDYYDTDRECKLCNHLGEYSEPKKYEFRDHENIEYFELYDEDCTLEFSPRIFSEGISQSTSNSIYSEDEEDCNALLFYDHPLRISRIQFLEKYMVSKFLEDETKEYVSCKLEFDYDSRCYNDDYISRFVLINPLDSINIFMKYKPFLKFYDSSKVHPLYFDIYFGLYKPASYLMLFYFTFYNDIYTDVRSKSRLYSALDTSLFKDNVLEINFINLSYRLRIKRNIEYIESNKDFRIVKYFDLKEKKYYDEPLVENLEIDYSGLDIFSLILDK